MLIGEWLCLTRRSERCADDDSDGAGANPVGRIVGVAPKSIRRGKTLVIDPHGGINVIVTEGTVHIRTGPNPAIGVWRGGGKCSLLGIRQFRHDKIGKRPNRRMFSESVALALVCDDDSGSSWAKIEAPIRLRVQVRQKAKQSNAKNVIRTETFDCADRSHHVVRRSELGKRYSLEPSFFQPG